MPKESQKTQKREREFICSIVSILSMCRRHCLAYGEEVALDPLKDGSQTEKNRTSEEEDTDNTGKTASTTEAHQDHGEGEGRDDEASETHGYGIGEALDVVAMAGSLRGEVKLLEQLWRDGHAIVRGGDVEVVVVRLLKDSIC
jgi:hypothetical protein